MNGLRLDYVALSCQDLPRVQALFSDSLGLPSTQVPTPGGSVPGIALGQVMLLLLEIDDERLDGPANLGLHHMGLACDDATALLAGTRLDGHAMTGQGLVAGQIALDGRSCGGVRARLGPALPISASGSSDLVERLDHIGIASTDNRAAEALFATELGFAVESRQTDMEVQTVMESFTSDRYGAIHHARSPQAVGGLRVSFITVGDCELEFLEEFDPQAMSESRSVQLGHGPGTTRQDQGAIGRFIQRRGPGLHHLAIKTPDIDQLLERLAGAGTRIIDSVGRPGSRRARIGFVHPGASGGILIHFVERVPL